MTSCPCTVGGSGGNGGDGIYNTGTINNDGGIATTGQEGNRASAAGGYGRDDINGNPAEAAVSPAAMAAE